MIRQKEKKAKKMPELGANLVEYALLVTLIALLSVISIRAMGASVSNSFSTVSSAMGN